MGIVLEAQDVRLQRAVALKLMRPSLATSESARKRFLREARAAASIQHDHIVTIYEVGEFRGIPYLAMELLHGETLAECIRREGTLPMCDVLRLARQITAGLAAAHQCGVIHRDVKPGNIWLQRENGRERVKLLDFGLARIADDHSSLTQVGAIAGTPAYMAPEQAKDGPVDHRADLFSLGCVLYEMCTGRTPFAAQGTMATLMAVAKQQPKPPHLVNPDLPHWLSEFVMRLLEKDPDRRIQSAGNVLAVLEERVHLRPRTLRTWLWRHRPRLWIAAMGAVLVVLLGIVIRVATDKGTVVLKIDQPDVTITVDGQPVKLQLEGEDLLLKVPSGVREIRVAKSGFRPYARKVRVDRGGQVAFEVALAPVEAMWRLRKLKGSAGGAGQFAFSRDGRLAVSAHGRIHGRIVCLWDMMAGREIGRFDGHTGDVRSVEFSPDGRSLVAACMDGTLRLWDVDSKHERRRFEGHADTVYDVDFTPDGTRVVSAGQDRTIRVWDVSTGRCVRTLTGHLSWVRSVDVSPDGQFLLSGGNDVQVLLWDLATGTLRRVLQGHTGPVFTVAFSADGRRALSAGTDRTVRFWDIDRESEIRVLTGHQAEIHRVVFLAASERAISVSADRTVRLWNLRTGRSLVSFGEHLGNVAVSADGRYALSGAEDDTIQLWQLPDPETELAIDRTDGKVDPPEQGPEVEPLKEIRRFQTGAVPTCRRFVVGCQHGFPLRPCVRLMGRLVGDVGKLPGDNNL